MKRYRSMVRQAPLVRQVSLVWQSLLLRQVSLVGWVSLLPEVSGAFACGCCFPFETRVCMMIGQCLGGIVLRKEEEKTEGVASEHQKGVLSFNSILGACTEAHCRLPTKVSFFVYKSCYDDEQAMLVLLL